MKAGATILLTGAGSGGHITPIIAVASELKHMQSDLHLIYIGQKGDGLGDIPSHDPSFDSTYTVRAGKFRRYHGEGLKQLIDLPTLFKNIRDSMYVLIGYYQSRKLLKTIQPDIIFIKGGFVGVPVGLAAASLHIPYITHDSDAIPGLANRIISKWASLHAVALPKDIYQYEQSKTVTTGIPLQNEFKPVTPGLNQQYRKELKLPESARILLIIGGGLGAQRINMAVSDILPHLLHEFSDLQVIHIVGRTNIESMTSIYKSRLSVAEQGRVQIFGFINDVYRYSGAADIIITRAGATNLAEFALQGKACIVIPSPFLAGGHQLKNAQYLMNRQAAIMLQESDMQDDPNRLAKQISILLHDTLKRDALGSQLSQFAKPKATHDLAALILSFVQEKVSTQS